MISEVTMPSMGADMTEGTIVKWLKKEGDEVKRGDKLAEIETDKTVVEMECYNDGILKKIIVQEGQAVPVGDLIAYIGDEGDDVPETSSSQSASSEPSANDSPQVENKPESVSSSSNVKVKASPIAKKLATELGVDLSAISGTGPGGRITREDVEAAAQAMQRKQWEELHALTRARVAEREDLGVELGRLSSEIARERADSRTHLEAERSQWKRESFEERAEAHAAHTMDRMMDVDAISRAQEQFESAKEELLQACAQERIARTKARECFIDGHITVCEYWGHNISGAALPKSMF